MKFNGTGQCLSPLVPTDTSASYYPGIEGCGVRCKDPLYTDDEHRQIHKLIGRRVLQKVNDDKFECLIGFLGVHHVKGIVVADQLGQNVRQVVVLGGERGHHLALDVNLGLYLRFHAIGRCYGRICWKVKVIILKSKPEGV